MSESTDETLEEPIDGEPVEDITEPSDPPPKKGKTERCHDQSPRLCRH